MANLGNNGLSKLWVRMKAYINNRIANLEQGITMDLLWENASPTSEFAEQFVSINTSEYSTFLIESRYASVDGCENTEIASVDYGEKIILTVFSSLTDSNVGKRMCAILSNGIQFGAGGYNTTTGNNVYVIPTKIYGIKGVN